MQKFGMEREQVGNKDAGCHVNHSASVLRRLHELVDSDTCDVVFCCSSSSAAAATNESDPTSAAPESARNSENETELCIKHRSDGGGGGGGGFGGDCKPQERQAGAGTTAGEAAPAAGHGGAAEAVTRAAVAIESGGEERCRNAGEMPVGEGTTTPKIQGPPAGPWSRHLSSSWSTGKRRTITTTSSSREFRCHRVLFASCSEYFRALLYGGMLESETKRVELRDVAPEGFEAIVNYVYTGHVRLAADNVMDIFSLAHRFGMDELLRACSEVLDKCMNCDDVCRVLEAVEYYHDEVLEAKCWDLIRESTPRVLKSESFLDLPWPLVLALVREEELQVDEADLFKAVQAWVRRDPGERGPRAGELSRHIRLPLMSLRELMTVVRPAGLVAAESILDAVTYHADPDQWSGDPLMVRPRGKRFKWDASSLAAGAWTDDENRTVTTSVADWVGVYGDRMMRSGFHRWSIRANKIGRCEKKAAWGAVIGIARSQSQNTSRPYLPITGFITGTGNSTLGGNTAADDYAGGGGGGTAVRDGDVVTVVYDADAGALSFFINQTGLGVAYSGLSGPMVAALAVSAAGAQWEIVDCSGGGSGGGQGVGGVQAAADAGRRAEPRS